MNATLERTVVIKCDCHPDGGAPMMRVVGTKISVRLKVHGEHHSVQLDIEELDKLIHRKVQSVLT